MTSPCRLLLACLLATAASAGEPADPAATVGGWIKALQANDLVGAWDRLPEAQRAAWGHALAPQADAGGPGGDRRGDRRGGGERARLEGSLRLLAEGEQAAQAGRLFAIGLAGFAAAAAPDGQMPPTVNLPGEQPFLAFLPRTMATGILPGLAQAVLAKDLETQQITAIDAWALAYAAWAKTAPFADEARAAAAMPHVQAFAAELRKPQPGADARAVLAAWATALPRLKQAFAVFGLDADAALAGAKVEAGKPAADGSVVVTVRFPAFGGEHALPLKLKPADGGWSIVADSPALRWLRGGGGPPGRFPGMQVGRPGGGRGLTPADPPPDAPRQGQPAGF